MHKLNDRVVLFFRTGRLAFGRFGKDDADTDHSGGRGSDGRKEEGRHVRDGHQDHRHRYNGVANHAVAVAVAGMRAGDVAGCGGADVAESLLLLLHEVFKSIFFVVGE